VRRGQDFEADARRESPAFYDRLMHECFRGGFKAPRIVQDAVNEATILSLVSQGMGGVNGTDGGAPLRCCSTDYVLLLSVATLLLL
jgi:hypothetical protein